MYELMAKFQSIDQHDEKVLNALLSTIKPNTPIIVAKEIGHDFVSKCKFYVPNENDNEARIKQKIESKRIITDTINRTTSATKLVTVLYNVLLAGEGLKVIK